MPAPRIRTAQTISMSWSGSILASPCRPDSLEVAVEIGRAGEQEHCGGRHHHQPPEALALLDRDVAPGLGRAVEAQADEERADADREPDAEEEKRVYWQARHSS